MPLVIAAIVGVVFGAGDQYLGSLTAATALGFWTSSVSGLSAPWLVVPFLAGRTQGRPHWAASIGLVITLAALTGYFAMTLSPMEGVRFRLHLVRELIGSNRLNVLGGAVLGPLFGWLGYRWRTRRWWVAAAVVAGALCLEPFAVTAVGKGAGRSGAVWVAEVAAGLGAGLWFLAISRGYEEPRRRRPLPCRPPA